MSEVDQQPLADDGHNPQATAPLRTKPLFKIGKIGLEVVLITAGVFLGLLGEGWRENAEHRGLADASLRRFRSEFQANKAEVERVHGRHVQELEALQKYFAEPTAATADGDRLRGCRVCRVGRRARDAVARLHRSGSCRVDVVRLSVAADV